MNENPHVGGVFRREPVFQAAFPQDKNNPLLFLQEHPLIFTFSRSPPLPSIINFNNVKLMTRKAKWGQC